MTRLFQHVYPFAGSRLWHNRVFLPKYELYTGAVIVAIRDDYWRLSCPVCRSRKVLGLNPVVLLGAITGSMTSGASLSVVINAAKSLVPVPLGYTGSYAFANVLLTICGSIILAH